VDHQPLRSLEPPRPDPRLFELLASQASPSGYIELPRYIEASLYHPTLGYYRKALQRVGRNSASDFYTASSLRDAFAGIVLEAAVSLLDQAALDPAETIWVEIGAEPGAALLSKRQAPFRETRAIGPGDQAALPEKALVFSNEVFDAQPFRKIRRAASGWTELGLRLEEGHLQWSPRSRLSEEARAWVDKIDRDCPIGYTIDLPTGAEALGRQILAQSWQGAFLAFDYGKSWQALLRDSPQGSARAYFRHRQLSDILAAPGQTDITHHICWDPLEAQLQEHAFSNISLQSQEAFILRRAPRFLAEAFSPRRDALDPLRSQLKELAHPAHMGQRFQALSAVRR